MFEEASRLKLRFETSLGKISVEDLWDLPLTSKRGHANLDDIAINLYNQTKNENISFVEPERKTDSVLQLKLDIIKRIIQVRVEEKAKAQAAAQAAERKQQLLAVLARKENAELESMPIEDIRRMINEL